MQAHRQIQTSTGTAVGEANGNSRRLADGVIAVYCDRNKKQETMRWKVEPTKCNQKKKDTHTAFNDDEFIDPESELGPGWSRRGKS